jgi:predicted Zn-dependent protease
VPRPSTKTYDAFLSAFYTGTAGLQVGDDVRAETGLSEAAAVAPGEPAAWVNWGVLALRQRAYDQAAERLGHAHVLAPGNSQIDYLLGLLESERGNTGAAISNLQAAFRADPRNLRAAYQLASEIERQGDPASEDQFAELMRQILKVEPGNVAAELELSRVAAKTGDTATLQAMVKQIAGQGAEWPDDVRQQLAALEAAAAGPEPRAAPPRDPVDLPAQCVDAGAELPRQPLSVEAAAG